MSGGVPILCGMDEFERLHRVAYAAAIQTGAKGDALDHVLAGIVRVLLAEANRATIRAERHPPLRLVRN